MFACAAQVHAGSKLILIRGGSVGRWQVTVRSQRDEQWVARQATGNRHRPKHGDSTRNWSAGCRQGSGLYDEVSG